MFWQTTQGITIEVASKYEEIHSKPVYKKYVHSYHINIINDTPHSIQLLRRHWFIYDSDNSVREVEGSGVVGEQPIIRSGDKYSYSSWSPLHTAIGKMNGYFTMMNIDTDEMLKVVIPDFNLVANHKLN